MIIERFVFKQARQKLLRKSISGNTNRIGRVKKFRMAFIFPGEMANLIDDRNVRSRNLMFQIPAECVMKRCVPLSRRAFSW